ncbi:hypothetical protein P9112_014588 [Eukaryota sp. TZLM1-RC]
MNDDLPGQVPPHEDSVVEHFDSDVNQSYDHPVPSKTIETNKYEDLEDSDLKPVKFSSRIEVFTSMLSWAFLPLKRTVVEIERVFGSSCAYYFSLTRSVLGAIFLLGLFSGSLLYRHIKELWENDQSALVFLDGLYPGFFLPSTLSPDLRDHWAVFITFGYFIVIIFVGMFIVFSSRLMYRHNAAKESQTIDTPTFMNLIYSWNWNQHSEDQVDHERNLMNENLKIALTEEDVRTQELKEKKKGASGWVKFKRFCGILVFLVWALIIAGIVIFLFQYEPQESDEDGWIEMGVSLFVSSLIALVNLASPKISDWIVALQCELDPAKRSATRLTLLFGFRMLSLSPIVFDVGFVFITSDAEVIRCPLNLAGKNIQNIMFVAFVLDIVIPLSLRLALNLLKFIRGAYKGKSFEEKVQMRPEFNYQDYALKLMYHYVLTILSLPFSPFTPIISFFLAYINAKYVKWFMKKFLKPPKNTLRTEEDRFVFSLYLMKLMVFCGFVLSLFVSFKHPCGAFFDADEDLHKAPMYHNILLHPMFWVPMAFVFFAWFRSSVGFTKSQCYREQLILRKKAANAAISDLKKKLYCKHIE